MQEHLDLKDFLLSPKMSDKVTTWYYYEGWRLCDISVGRKFIHVKPVYGGYPRKKLRVKQGREILKTMYWKAASTDAYYRALADGKKRKARNWEKLYA